jgi:hypothetical protein
LVVDLNFTLLVIDIELLHEERRVKGRPCTRQ